MWEASEAQLLVRAVSVGLRVKLHRRTLVVIEERSCRDIAGGRRGGRPIDSGD
jgi:hypothetical protein